MIKIQCQIEHITYQNPENGFTILKARMEGVQNTVTVVGNFFNLPAGTVLQCEGNWKTNQKFGNEFVVEQWMEVLPATAAGIEKYLGSGLIKGVGRKVAHLIVERFGVSTIDIIENHSDRLYEVPTLGTKRIEQIRESWNKHREIKHVMIFLQGYGVNASFAAKIFARYGNQSITMVKNNPYRLADEISGIGFKTADEIAQNMGYGLNNVNRCRSGILFTMKEMASEGNVYATQKQLISACALLLGLHEEPVGYALQDLIAEKVLIQEDEAIYLPYLYFSEVGTAEHLFQLLHIREGVLFEEHLNLKDIEKESGIEYDEIQLEAIQQAIRSKIMILTGGPGTGKTTTTQGIIAAFKHSNLRILLAAPTGRAAKRMSEATHMEAKTIHRLLEYKPDEGFKRNSENPLEGDALIVDECSMIDIPLMYNLMKAIPMHMRLVLVGDIDQLPSVGAGNVLRDLIDSRKIPVTRLTRIFRQAQSSRIVMSAHAINEGRLPDLSNGQQTDFFFIHQEDADRVPETIVQLVKTRLPKTYNVPYSHIQVLSPMQKGSVGTGNLNRLLQEALNPSTVSINHGGILFKEGDRVMQLQNNYDKEVFNGDIGCVLAIDTIDRVVTVDFEGHLVNYEASELDELNLAYATTIHKSQGSEYPIVVIPVLMSHYIMLQRNLIYTGITRSKKICVLIGQEKALSYAIENLQVVHRNSRLKDRLQKLKFTSAMRMIGEGQVCNASNQKKLTATEQNFFPEGQQELFPSNQEKDTAERLSFAEFCRLNYPPNRFPELFNRLSHSPFRMKFHLSSDDLQYIDQKGLDTIRQHASDFVSKRLATAHLPNDGRQTPTKGHPIFIAQHATGCCCRGCLHKWHHIDEDHPLTPKEQEYVVNVLMAWVHSKYEKHAYERYLQQGCNA